MILQIMAPCSNTTILIFLTTIPVCVGARWLIFVYLHLAALFSKLLD